MARPSIDAEVQRFGASIGNEEQFFDVSSVMRLSGGRQKNAGSTSTT